MNEYTIPFLQDQYGQDEVIETLLDYGKDTGYLMTVLKKGIRDRDVATTYLLRERMGISKEAIGTAYIKHYFINCSVARS